jgi:hypothetical protein
VVTTKITEKISNRKKIEKNFLLIIFNTETFSTIPFVGQNQFQPEQQIWNQNQNFNPNQQNQQFQPSTRRFNNNEIHQKIVFKN